MTIEDPDPELARALSYACINHVPFPISSILGGPPLGDAYIDSFSIDHDWQEVTTYGSPKREWIKTGWTVSVDFREA